MEDNITFSLRKDVDWEKLRYGWEQLEARSDASFFQSAVWIGSWLEELAAKPLLVLGHQAGEPVVMGLVHPVTRRRHLVIKSNAVLLHHFDDAYDRITIEHNGFLFARRVGIGCISKCADFLINKAGYGWRRTDELQLKGVSDNYERDYDVPFVRPVVITRQPSWIITLANISNSGSSYLQHLRANSRQQIRRSMRLYETRGKLALKRARDVQEALDFFSEMKRLHELRWKSKGEASSFDFPFFERFHRRLISTGLPRGLVEMVRIDAGKDAIGYLYNFVYRNRVTAYQSGFAYEQDKRLKPGLVSHYLCIEEHLKRNALVYDFLAGNARHKEVLGTPGPQILDIALQRNLAKFRIEHLVRELKRGIANRVEGAIKGHFCGP